MLYKTITVTMTSSKSWHDEVDKVSISLSHALRKISRSFPHIDHTVTDWSGSSNSDGSCTYSLHMTSQSAWRFTGGILVGLFSRSSSVDSVIYRHMKVWTLFCLLSIIYLFILRQTQVHPTTKYLARQLAMDIGTHSVKT